MYKVIIVVADLAKAEQVTAEIEGWVFAYYDSPPTMYIEEVG